VDPPGERTTSHLRVRVDPQRENTGRGDHRRIDEIREADVKDGANRYRARFLRAKRFDDDGNLCGVLTDPDDE